MPCPHGCIFEKSYGLNSTSCTGFVRVIGYKYLLSSARTIKNLLVLRRGGGRGKGEGGDENDLHYHGPNTNEGGGGVNRGRMRGML